MDAVRHAAASIKAVPVSWIASFVVALPQYFTGRVGPSGLGSASTAAQVGEVLAANIKNKTCLITGVGPNGIGLEAARVMLLRGATVIVAARRPDVAREAVETAVEADAECCGRLHAVRLDLSSLKDIDRCAAEVIKLGLPIDTIIFNAGVMMCPLLRTTENMEMQVSTIPRYACSFCGRNLPRAP